MYPDVAKSEQKIPKHMEITWSSHTSEEYPSLTVTTHAQPRVRPIASKRPKLHSRPGTP